MKNTVYKIFNLQKSQQISELGAFCAKKNMTLVDFSSEDSAFLFHHLTNIYIYITEIQKQSEGYEFLFSGFYKNIVLFLQLEYLRSNKQKYFQQN